ncbi:hypothetical protein SDRG_04030 [Saprolegnia diclina VS20]|uniref:Uncharacterized protein n=1 Tax=Saprolegnia diclina (strain VS20) TaxID=1156394 RepID=T0QW83_SAPDV|nr:hypothetical protein SDRG_04030 [Saprolegnia diclina VS20]EQC38310.1 hypothetical protein SDRG_04030 [Saprolegnia diclina VS20]|eukprot:XP_008607902.1 hypothetical protein SDRG_04030 [Saprolegnia diclina VS20]
MVIYYTKHNNTVMEKLGFRSKTFAMDVNAAKGSFTCMNTNTTFAIDAIVDAQWTNDKHLTLRVQHHGSVIKQQLIFENHADLHMFLSELGVHDAAQKRVSDRGSFSNATLPPTQKPFRRSI